VKSTTVRSRSIRANDRLDAHFFTSPGVAAGERIAILEASGFKVQRLADMARIWMPGRFARTYASSQEGGIPYLRPYDVFDYLPTATNRLSIARNAKIDQLILQKGMILQTCSGRNLGPCAYVDESLTAIAMSHDMARIEVPDDRLRYYVFAYLKTKVGQALLRRGKSGSVIDHLTASDIGAVPIALIDAHLIRTISDKVEHALRCISLARAQLQHTMDAYQQTLPTLKPAERTAYGWTIQANDVVDRLDCAFYAPSTRNARIQMKAAGGPECGEVCWVRKPQRYNRYYVDPAHGRPVLSGRQLLQIEPINLRYVSDRSFAEPDSYVLDSGMTIFGAVGRSEGRLGSPALVTDSRAGWLASEDVARLVPKDHISKGALWLAIASTHSQLQLKSLAFGSVIDHMDPRGISQVTLPPLDDDLGADAQHAWEQLAAGASELSLAVGLTDTALGSA
jgi:hypothetical protein